MCQKETGATNRQERYRLNRNAGFRMSAQAMSRTARGDRAVGGRDPPEAKPE